MKYIIFVYKQNILETFYLFRRWNCLCI